MRKLRFKKEVARGHTAIVVGMEGELHLTLRLILFSALPH
jgi:hypothetical protein